MDLKGPTLTLIKTTNGQVFGVYRTVSFNSTYGLSPEFQNDKASFIFSLTKKTIHRPTYSSINKSGNHGDLLIQQGLEDLIIKSMSNETKSSSNWIGNDYDLRITDPYKKESGYTYLAGSKLF